jgi:hypothetical protein
MDAIQTATVDTDVMGIVISRGAPAAAEPRFSLYVWGPAPESEPETTTQTI